MISSFYQVMFHFHSVPIGKKSTERKWNLNIHISFLKAFFVSDKEVSKNLFLLTQKAFQFPAELLHHSRIINQVNSRTN
jgi:hypothetical protein